MQKKSAAPKIHQKQTFVEADRVDVFTFSVGHGDCQLIEFWQQGRLEFRLLYDGGISLSPNLVSHLKNKRSNGSVDLDIVVLSHVDADHRAGINELLRNNHISIGEIWLPCLPAFRRLSWLFSERVQRAVTLAEEIEQLAIERDIPVIYPLQDHVQRAGNDSALQICVISPPRKLIKRLYSASLADLQPLLSHTPLPLEWLIRSSSYIDEEITFQQDINLFDSNYALTPGQLEPKGHEITPNETELDALNRYKTLQSEPEFFGQSIVNNTSIVLVIDALLEKQHRRRIVLTGDQENWVWIASEHPMGLSADVMKAPHHGGKIYLSDKDDGVNDVEQFWLWTRPRIVTVSANGKYSLPHCQFRESVRMIGATLVCPNKRGKEWIFSDTHPQAINSCSTHFNCETKAQHPVQRISLTARSESLNAAACLSGNGHRSPAPIVVMQQKLIEPDESFIRWTQTEVRKHAEWLNKNLLERRAMQLAALSLAERADSCFEELTIKEALAIFNGGQRHELVNDPEPVLRYAKSQGKLWIQEKYRINEETVVIAPLREKEYQDMLSRITRFDHLLFTADKNIDERTLITKDTYSLLKHFDTDALISLSARWAGVPDKSFHENIKPKLFHDLIKKYKIRLAKYDSFYQSGDSSTLLLHMFKDENKSLPSFIPNKWGKFHLETYNNKIEINKSKMIDLFEDKAQLVLPPIRSAMRYKGGPLCFYIKKEDLNIFYQCDDTINNNVNSEFSLAFRITNKLKWLDDY
ncbi:TPA: hypothetical protein RUX02_002350 [Aeromonas dhakensis]|nr:hypothetical protein [Aeromonas dhakensis]